MKKVQENQKNQKKKNKGFTLVELIIVIAIIAILAIVLAPQYIKYVEKSRWSNDVNQMNELVSMVKTAIVEVEDAGGSVTAQSASVTKTNGATFTGSLGDQLAADDKNYSNYKLKNNGSHSADLGSGVAAKTETYTINVSQDGSTWVVTGSWS
jgi:type IV pilus assembly protein PilA